jgi:hypothetical protein
MSDPDAMPDPMDEAYRLAERARDDEAARRARRDRVLAAVAQAPAIPATRPERPRSLWRRGGWLAAACVAGLSLIVVTQVYRPPRRETPPVAPAGAPPSHPAPATAPAVATSPAIQAATPSRDQVRAGRPAGERLAPSALAPRAAFQANAPSQQPPTASPRQSPSQLVAGQVTAAAPPPPPPPAAKAVPVEAAPAPPAAETAERGTPPAPLAGNNAGGAGAGARGENVTEIVVTGARRTSSRAELRAQRAALGAQLRQAAAAGDTDALAALLGQGVPVDAPDAEGNTALMESIRADRPQAAALLRRHGASLNRRNHAGQSARDLAKAKDEQGLDQAIGVSP